MAKLPALVIEIKENNDSSFITHKIQIKHQRYKGYAFGKDSRKFIASNGFSLRSVDVMEVREMNPPSGMRRVDNRLYVRGSYNYHVPDSIVTAYSQSYIEELKVAVQEYNEYMER